MNKSISRRNFLTGAAVALGGAAAAGMAGCAPSTPQQTLSETGEGAAAPGTRWSWETKPEPIADDEIVETIDTEICIVGLGSAGTTSAMAAAQSGAKVVVLQKLDKVITNGWCVAAFNSKMFLDAGQTYDLADIYFKFADLSNGRDNHKVVKTFLNRSGEVVDYVIRQTPDFTPVMLGSGHTYGWYINNDMATRYDQFHKLLDAIAEKAVATGRRYPLQHARRAASAGRVGTCDRRHRREQGGLCEGERFQGRHPLHRRHLRRRGDAGGLLPHHEGRAEHARRSLQHRRRPQDGAVGRCFHGSGSPHHDDALRPHLDARGQRPLLRHSVAAREPQRRALRQ